MEAQRRQQAYDTFRHGGPYLGQAMESGEFGLWKPVEAPPYPLQGSGDFRPKSTGTGHFTG